MKFPNLHGSKSPQTAQPYRRTEQSLPILPYSGYTFNYNQAAKFGYGANPYMAYTPYMGEFSVLHISAAIHWLGM